MTHLHVLNELSSTVEHQEQGVPLVQVAPENQIPKLYDIAFEVQLGVFNQLPLAERVGAIQNTSLSVDIRMRLLQPTIEEKLRKAKTDNAILVLFQEIKILCSEEAVFKPNLFTFCMKPIIQKVASERNMYMILQDFLAKTKAFSEDSALSEMFGLWYVINIQNQEELLFIFREQTFITKIKVIYTMGVAEARVLADSLKVNGTLTSLDLGCNNIGDEGARALADALKVDEMLTSLDLEDNQLGDEGARALADVLKVNGTLTSLYLLDNLIGAEGTRALADALKENETLTSLDLSLNGIEDADARALADALKVNRTLTSLDLGYNNIGDEGARALVDALKENKTLTSLDLGDNKIGVECARALADVLKESGTLTSLDLGDNKIGVECARALADVLKESGTLTSLNLGDNEIGWADEWQF